MCTARTTQLPIVFSLNRDSVMLMYGHWKHLYILSFTIIIYLWRCGMLVLIVSKQDYCGPSNGDGLGNTMTKPVD